MFVLPQLPPRTLLELKPQLTDARPLSTQTVGAAVEEVDVEEEKEEEDVSGSEERNKC